MVEDMDHYFHSKLLTQQMEEGDRDVDDDGDDDDDDDDDEPLSLFEYEDDNYHRYHDDDDAAIMLATENNDDLENSSSSEDDDDSNNSSSTTSSTTDDDGDDDNNDAEITPLQERRERNVRRNEQYMRDLKLGLNAMMVMRNDNASIDSNGISSTAQGDGNATAQIIMGGKNDGQRMRKSKSSSSSPSEAAHRMEDADRFIATDGKNQRMRRRGMLFSKQASSASSTQPMDNIDGAGTSVSSSSQQQLPPPLHLFTAKSISNELECKYPHRSHQIRTLTSCLVNTVRKSEFAAQQSSSTSQYHFSPSASPIMITGGSGNGKTHLVCDAVEILRQRSNTTTPKDYNNTTTPKRKRSCTSLVTVATAYVDCASSECDSASSAMDCAYRQAHADYFHGITNVMNNHGGGIRRGRSPRGEKTKKTMTTTMNKKKSKQENVDGMAGSSMTRIGGVGGGADDQEEEEEEEEERMANDTNFGEGYILEQGDDEDFDDDEDSIVEDQLERQRKNRKLLHNNNNMKKKNAKRTMSSAMSHGNNNSRTTARRQSRIGRATNTETTAGSGGLMSKSPRIEGSTTNSTVQGGGGSVALFGRAISSFSIRNGGNSYGNSAPPPSRCCMFLILDNADRILSWRRYGSIHPLTQIVMLPSVMGIDLTLIFISQSSIFQYSPVHNSAGTIFDAIHPMIIHFDSYTSVDAIKSILHVPHIRQSITGSSHCTFRCDRANVLLSNLKHSLYSSMMNSFVPSVISSTHDITEIVRLARLLWPEYLPLDRRYSNSNSLLEELVWQVLGCLRDSMSSNSDVLCHESDCCHFCRCLSSKADRNSPVLELNVLQQRLSEELDGSIRDKMRGLLSSTVLMPGRVLSEKSRSPYAERLPYETKFLLVAAFLCQNKRAEQDINLFTTTNTGKSRRGRSKTSNGGAAYATSSKDLTQRQPSFRLERMLSVFYSIIGQYGQAGASTGSRLGTTHLFQSVSMLVATKMLQIIGSSKISDKYDHDLSEMVLAKFSCTLCRDDARVIASSVGFPLEKYYP